MQRTDVDAGRGVDADVDADAGAELLTTTQPFRARSRRSSRRPSESLVEGHERLVGTAGAPSFDGTGRSRLVRVLPEHDRRSDPQAAPHPCDQAGLLRFTSR